MHGRSTHIRHLSGAIRVLATFLFAAALAGCGGQDQTPALTAPAATAAATAAPTVTSAATILTSPTPNPAGEPIHTPTVLPSLVAAAAQEPTPSAAPPPAATAFPTVTPAPTPADVTTPIPSSTPTATPIPIPPDPAATTVPSPAGPGVTLDDPSQPSPESLELLACVVGVLGQEATLAMITGESGPSALDMFRILPCMLAGGSLDEILGGTGAQAAGGESAVAPQPANLQLKNVRLPNAAGTASDSTGCPGV